VGLFSTAKKESQIGIEFQHDGIAVAQVRTGKNNPGDIIRSEFVVAAGQEAQVEALKDWVNDNDRQKTPCNCLVANDDCDIYQVERPEVEDSEMIQALTWKIKDLINYDVTHAVVDSYPMPVSSKNKQQQVGVVAAREAVISSYVESIKATALELNALDVHELVRSNLEVVQHSAEQSLALLTLSAGNGLLSVYHDTDLYVSREFPIGIDQLELASSEDESTFDALLLEIQRSVDYFESFYGIGVVTNLLVYPQLNATEKMAMYLQNLSNFDIDFITFDSPGLDPHCFHAYCAALRGLTS
jgi:MSHA biogenesis protein MshI